MGGIKSGMMNQSINRLLHRHTDTYKIHFFDPGLDVCSFGFGRLSRSSYCLRVCVCVNVFGGVLWVSLKGLGILFPQIDYFM
jgi:hypothetical protein